MMIDDVKLINYLNESTDNFMRFGNFIAPIYRKHFQHDKYIIMSFHWSKVYDFYCLDYKWKKTDNQEILYGMTHAYLRRNRLEISQFGPDRKRNQDYWDDININMFWRELKLSELL